MENDNNIKFYHYGVNLDEQEYNYICELLNSFYKNLSKLPKKMRTQKFYTLENLVKNVFIK